MAGDGSFLVEEFLEAIASQLDRAQDALAFKAVNRPLTYAIRDFNLQLHVFVDMDPEGNIRLRSSGPNESGASTLNIGFTTMTRAMVQENTVSLAATRAPSLADAGFAPAERLRLERLGVNNTAQLRRLGSTTGAGVVARLTQIPVERLRAALQLGKPQVSEVRPLPAASSPHAPASNGGAAPISEPNPGLGGARPNLIRLGPHTSHLHLLGTGLVAEEGPAEVRLNGASLGLSEADWDQIVVPIPADVTSGALEVMLPDGEVSQYQLHREGAGAPPDPWIQKGK